MARLVIPVGEKTRTPLTPEGYGAVGDGVTDDQTALANMLAALTPGDSVTFAPGKTYAHSGLLDVTVSDVTLNGYGSTLLATNPDLASLRINNGTSGVKVRGLRHTVAIGAHTRGSNGLVMSPFVLGHAAGAAGPAGVVLEDVVSEFSKGAGIFVYGATGFQLLRPVVVASLADGIHITNQSGGGSKDGLVVDAVVNRPADDGVAVVSYAANPETCKRIRIVRPTVSSQKTAGRGVAVVGGEDVTFDHPVVRGSVAAGVYVGVESGYNTHSTTRVRVNGGRVENAAHTLTSFGGGLGMLSQISGRAITDVVVRGLHVENTNQAVPANVRLQTANGGTIDNVTLDDIVLSGTGPFGDYAQTNTTDTTNVTRTGWKSLLDPRARTLAADITISTLSNTIPSGLVFTNGTTGTFLLECEGVYAHSETTTGPRWGVAGNSNTVDWSRGHVTQWTSLTAASDTPFVYGGGNGTAAVLPSAINTNYAFRLVCVVNITATAVSSPNIGPMVNVSGGTLTLRAGTTSRLTKIG